MILQLRPHAIWPTVVIASIVAFLIPSYLFTQLSDPQTLIYFSNSCFFIYAGISIGLFVQASRRTRQHAPSLWPTWRSFLFSAITIFLTMVTWFMVEVIMGQRGNISTGAIFLFTAHLLVGVGIYQMPKHRQTRLQTVRQAIDTLTILIGSALLLWLLWLNPLAETFVRDLDTLLVTLLYLLSDLILTAALISLFFRTQLLQPRGPLVFLGLAIFFTLVANLSFAIITPPMDTLAGTITDQLYLAALICNGAAAALQILVIDQGPSKPHLTDQPARLMYGLRMTLPALMLLVTYGVMLLTHHDRMPYLSYLMAAGIGSMFLLVSIRQVLTLWENVRLAVALRKELADRQQAQVELQRVNETLEQHVAERTKELMVLNEQLRDNERKLRFDALHDKLTGLLNRTAFIHHLESALQAARTDATYRFAVLFLDFDGFKVVNDSLGHWLGDEFLIGLARRLKEYVPVGNLVARLGGDEFVVLIEHIDNNHEVLEIAEQIQRQLRRPLEIRGYRLYTTASIGVVIRDEVHTTAGDLLRDADIAMYRAKESGKARCVVFDAKMRAQAVTRLRLETALRNALLRNEFYLVYQPIWNVAEQRVTGFEALARWQHPEHGAIAPAEFIPIAEETGLIIPLGEWVLEEACRQLKLWQAQWPQVADLTVSVNISAQQLYQGDLPAVVQQTLQKTALAASALKLEITESIFMEDVEAAIDACSHLRAMGVYLQIDDFGTGYSSFNYLHRLPINTLKIDKSFIDLLNLGGQHIEIVRTIATLAHNLQMSVIAEGVETQEQLTHVAQLGCEQVQGYLIAKPLRGEAAAAFIQSALDPESDAPAPAMPSPPPLIHHPLPSAMLLAEAVPAI